MIPNDSRFFQYIDFLLIIEGGVNKKILHLDRGGLTNHGVRYDLFKKHLHRYSKHKFYLSDRWKQFIGRDQQVKKVFDVKKYTKEDHIGLMPSDVKFFYFKDYWEPIKADNLPSGLDIYLFDFTVHSGQGNAVKTLQKVVAAYPDGAVGPNTLAAINDYIEYNGIKRLIKEFDKARRAFLSGTSAGVIFAKGFDNRLQKVMHKAYEQLGDVYVDDRKPLSQSNTLKAAKGGAVSLGAIEAANILAPDQRQAEDAIKNIIDNVETINTVTSVISKLYNYNIEIVLLVALCFFGYLYFNRIRDFVLGKK